MTRDERAKRDRALERRYARNIVRAYRRASDRQRERGSLWYPNEGALAASIDPTLSRSVCCAVVAAISPGLKWERNVYWSREVVDAWKAGREYALKVPTYSHANVRKAIRILAGEDPDSVLSGPKVRAFWRLLRDGGNAEDVCVDGHAVHIARGTDGAIRGEGSDGARVSEAQYRVVAAAYRRAARTLGRLPYEVQATTWIARRDDGQEVIPF